jgi:hypothetical protein
MDLPNENQRTFWASHRDLCRFSSEEDSSYQRLADWIAHYVAGALSERVAEQELVATAQTPLIDTTEPDSADIAG